MDIYIFALLVFGDQDRPLNMGKGLVRKHEVYAKNAALLAKSLGALGPLHLFTDNVNELNMLMVRLGVVDSIEVIKLSGRVSLPGGIRFAGAHQKIEAFRQVGNTDNQYLIFLDLDMICISPPGPPLLTAIKLRIPIVYKITEQVVAAYSQAVIIKDSKKLNPNSWRGEWYGGELIGGTPSFFKQLVCTVDEMMDSYLINWRELHHQGDEALVSAALETLIERGIDLFDAGPSGAVMRNWSGVTKHQQRSLVFENLSFLHVPQDKVYLAGYFDKHPGDFAPDGFIACYRRFLYWRRLRRLGVGFVKYWHH